MALFTPEAVRTTSMSDFVSPSTRRRRAGITPPVFVDSISRNDDSREKRQRVISSTTSAILSSPVTPHSRTASRSRIGGGRERCQAIALSGSEGLSNLQIKEIYTNCVQLSAANKITSKNAFGLHLIDYMQDLIRNVQEGESTNFQVAGYTLDASAKIYAGRVDLLHSQTYKIFSGFGRTENDENAAQEDNPDKEFNLDPQDSQRKKKKYTGKQGSKIARNVDILNVKQFDLEFEVDPLFQKTSAAFDEGGVRGLLLNNLSLRDDTSCELLLDSTAVINVESHNYLQNTTEVQPQTTMVDLSEFRDLFNKMIDDSIKICHHFADFEFTKWDRNETAASTFQMKDTAFDHVNSDCAFDVNALPASDTSFELSRKMEDDSFVDDDAVFGEDMEFGRAGCAVERPVANLIIGKEALAFADGKEAQLLNPSQAKLLHCTPPDGVFGSLCLELSEQPSDYSYFNPDFLANWTNPEAWKMGMKKGPKVKSTCRPKQTRVKQQLIDPWGNDINFEKYFRRKKAATILAEPKMNMLSRDKTSLPENLQYAQEDLTRLVLKPSILIKRQDIDSAAAIDNGDLINFNNEGDRNEYCPNFEVNGAEDDSVDGVCDDGSHEQANGDRDSQNMTSDMTQSSQGFSFNSELTLVDQTMFAGDGLVPQPSKVQRIDIRYAKTAKEMDVKKLKSTMWNILTEPEAEENKENVPAAGNCEQQQCIPARTEKMTKSYPFDELCARLTTRLPKRMTKNLTTPIAFVSLLHLANEKCLHLSAQDTLDNIVIRQDN